MDLPAEHYRKHSSLQYGLAQKALRHANFTKTCSILDVGCGDGKITAELAKTTQNTQVIGIDASPNMIALAKDSFAHINFFCINAEEMSLGQSFHFITCLSCLHWIRDPKKALANMAEHLKEGGELIILVYLKSKYSECLEKALEAFPEYIYLSSFRKTFTLDQYAEMIKNLKMNVTVCETEDLIAYYPDSNSLKNYIKGWLVSYVPLPESLQDAYLEKVAKISETYADSNHGFHIPYKTGVIKAVK